MRFTSLQKFGNTSRLQVQIHHLLLLTIPANFMLILSNGLLSGKRVTIRNV